MSEQMQTQLRRLILTARQRERDSVGDPAPYAAPDCRLCDDAGMVERSSGWWRTPGGYWMDATPEHPVYVRCECNPKPDPSTQKPRSRRYAS